MANNTSPFAEQGEPASEEEQIEEQIAAAEGPRFSDFSTADLESTQTNYLIQIFMGGCFLVVAFLFPGSPFYFGIIKWVLGLLGGGLSLIRVMQVNGIHQELVNRGASTEPITEGEEVSEEE